MKFLKLKGLPAPLVKALVDAYNWGYDDREKGLLRKEKDEIERSLNTGFREGMRQRG